MALNPYRDMLNKDVKSSAEKLGTAGLSERQKAQQRAQAMQAAGQQAQVQQTGLNRQMMAQGGQMQGAYAQQANQLANAGAQAGAQAGFQAEQMSQQIAQARDAQIRASIKEAADARTATLNKAVDVGMGLAQMNAESGQEEDKAAAAASAAQMAALASDRRLKQNIESVGVDSATGLNIYDFEYKTDPSRRYRGVMADEVEVGYPEAVIYGDDGFAKVHYGLLGLEMTEI